MTPQEQELIQNIARRLREAPNKTKDTDAEYLINQEIASQSDIIYKLTQAVLVQEMALKDLKQRNEYLEKSSNYYQNESNRSAFSKMMGGNRPQPPQEPQPSYQPSAFGGFMKTAAGVAAGMVAGHLISDALFGGNDAQPEEIVENVENIENVDNIETPNDDNSSFLNNEDNAFASEYTDPNSGFGSGGFGDNSDFDGGFANNDDPFVGGDDGFFGGDDGGFDDSDDV